MFALSHRDFLAQDYALVNPMQVALDQRNDLETIKLLPKGLERHARMMPLLLDLKSLQESVRLELLERADRWGRHYDMPLFSALLKSDAGISGLKAHLIRNLLLPRPGAGRFWLRFHDPRVFRHLRWLLDGEQMACLMGPVAAWTWYAPLDGSWHMHARRLDASYRLLQLTPTQWVAMDQIEALNRCLRDMSNESSSSPDDKVAKQLMGGLIEAQQLGLREVADKGLYARQRLRYGVEFTLQEETRLRVRRVQEGEISYIAACGDESRELLSSNG